MDGLAGPDGLYFAYGSNLDVGRLRRRVGAARVQGVARLDGHRLAFNKRGRDGSGKANLVDDPLGSVWGALYSLEPAAWEPLDRFEGGYERVALEVEDPAGRALEVVTYRSRLLCADPPFAWYKELVVAGARRHGLPESYVAWLASLRAQPDPACDI